jgi:hypothetical protein
VRFGIDIRRQRLGAKHTGADSESDAGLAASDDYDQLPDNWSDDKQKHGRRGQ